MGWTAQSIFNTIPPKIWILLFISLVIRVAVFFSVSTLSDVIQHQILIFDSLGYHDLALCIKIILHFAEMPFVHRLSIFCSHYIFAFGNYPYTVLFVQIFLNLLSIV